MSYSSGEALVLTRVQACSGFSSANTARSNWKILNQGKSAFYAILRPGQFRSTMIGTNRVQWNYITVIELWQRYKDDATTQTALYANMEALKAGLLPYRTLADTGNTIQDAMPRIVSEPMEMWVKRGGPSWLKYELQLEWSEEESITFQN